jgi:hypothetical protein
MSRARWRSLRRAAAALLALAAGVALADARTTRADERAFPHLAHARLFPSCAGCHAAIVDSTDPRRASGLTDPATARERFPPPELCAECHTDRERPIPPWRGPTAQATNLAFAHDAHARAQRDSMQRIDCAACHALPGETRRMAVGRARPAACLACHAPGTPHLAESSPCATCHVPLVAATRLSPARVAALPRPPSHEAGDFVARHGRLAMAAPSGAQCAVCHSTESCARCHMNAAALPSVAALGRDARVAAATAGRAPSYHRPASHADPSWQTTHGAMARRSTATCANCHAQRSCATCHVGSGARSVIATLPAPAPDAAAQGVRLRRVGAGGDANVDGAPSVAGSARVPQRIPPRDPPRDPVPSASPPPADTTYAVRIHPADFARAHAAAAGTQSPRCASCHEQSFCAACHAGEGRRRFHPVDFALRHAPAAYGRERDCRSCHNTEAFCRACHVSSGLASGGRRDVAFHDAQPRWLLQHGRAARQGLESCTTCHAQRDCMQCHSTRGLQVNPHGPGFDPRRMAARSRVACIACHGRDPLATP